MPQRLKRRSEAISRNASETEDDDVQQASRQRQRQRRDDSPASETTLAAGKSGAAPVPSDSDNEDDSISNDEDAANDSQAQHKIMVKKLVRLALSAEYSRQPIRRTDINAKILKNSSGNAVGGRNTFKAIFTSAQETLRDVFGMEMVDLPTRERTGIAERRKAASQKATQRETQATRIRDEETQSGTQSQKNRDPILSAQSWILVSTLPMPYRVHPTLLVPARAPDIPTESAYTALYTLIVSLIYLHAPSGSSSTQDKADTTVEDTTEPLSDAKLHRWLSRLDLDSHIPAPVDLTLERVLGRMIKEGYVERRRDTSSGEEVVEWVVGPRGKKEIGRTGIAKLVRGVYGFGVDGTGKGLQVPSDLRAEEDENEDQDPDQEQEEGEGSRRRGRVKMERDELERRLERTLGAVVKMDIRGQDTSNTNGLEAGEGQEEDNQMEEPEGSRRNGREASNRSMVRRSGRHQSRNNDNDEDEEDER